MTPNEARQWLEAWRAGSGEAPAAADALLRHYQPWLRMMARGQVDTHLGGKVGVSDVVQQTLAEAVRAFPGFRGTTDAEFAVWLRRILAHVLAHEVRKYRGTAKRDVAREVSFELELDSVSQRLGDLIPGRETSPTAALAQAEQQRQLAAVLERLPDDYRTVLVLRHLEGFSHEEIARRLGRNPGAVRMLWVRALARLRQEYEAGRSATPESPGRRG